MVLSVLNRHDELVLCCISAACLFNNILSTLISIYNAIVRPYFDYCCEVWDVFGESQSKRLQKFQNGAATIILNMSNDVNHSIALRALGWEPLKTERKKAKAKIMYKVLNKMGPKSLTNLFSYKCQKTNYNLRDISSGLSLPKPRTNNIKIVSCMTEPLELYSKGN